MHFGRKSAREKEKVPLLVAQHTKKATAAFSKE
jgi:hypothetical protein